MHLKLLTIICLYLFAPLIIIVLICLYVYHLLVEIVLRIQFQNKFAGMMKGIDSICANEKNVSLSVINILLVLKKNAGYTNASLMKDMRKLMRYHFTSIDAASEKIFYHRNRKFGYYFWEKRDEYDIENKIRWLECENLDCDGSCEDVSSEFFRKNLGNVCNKLLPDDNKALWECLITKRCPRSNHAQCIEGHLLPEDCVDSDSHEILVVFRFHHSLGDGIALLKFMLEKIADKNEMEASIMNIKNVVLTNEDGKSFKETIPLMHNPEKDEITNFQNKIINNKTKISSTSQQTQNTLKRLYDKIKQIVQLAAIVLCAPICLVQQIYDTDDALHGVAQTGEKIVSFWLEDDITNKGTQKLLTEIREIRKNTGTKFGDVVLAAFSVALHKYYLRINELAPDKLTTIMTIRMAVPGENVSFDNMFSIVYVPICISNANGRKIADPNRNSQFLDRLRDIARENDKFKKSANYLINFWMLKYVPTILTADIISAYGFYCTMVFSNMFGPQYKARICGNIVNNVAFWVPTRSSVVLAFTLLSYGGNLQLALLADKSIIQHEKYFANILIDTVHEINSVYNTITSSEI